MTSSSRLQVGGSTCPPVLRCLSSQCLPLLKAMEILFLRNRRVLSQIPPFSHVWLCHL